MPFGNIKGANILKGTGSLIEAISKVVIVSNPFTFPVIVADLYVYSPKWESEVTPIAL